MDQICDAACLILIYFAGGLLIFTGQANLQYVTTASFLFIVYSNYLADVEGVVNCGGTVVTPGQLYEQARKQVTTHLIHAIDMHGNLSKLQPMLNFNHHYDTAW